MDYNKLPKDMKLAIYSFIIGFIISFLIGAITRNPAGIISFRAFVSGVLFGGLVYAGLYLLRRYIPELEIVTVSQKTGNQKISEDAKSPALEYAGGDESKVSQHVKVEEPEDMMSVGESGKDVGEERTPIAPETEEGTDEEALPSLDRLFEEEDTVPDVEIEKEVKKEDKRIVGDYINVGNVRIPNEPEVIARAIKKVMSADER
jgi:hypothetical protein